MGLRNNYLRKLEFIMAVGLIYSSVIAFCLFITLSLAQELADNPETATAGESKQDLQSELKKMPLEERLNQLISLDLRNIEIVEALRYLATKGALNIITTKNVSGRVSFTLENVALKDVFDLMLRVNGLAYTKEEGDIFNVMTEQEYKALYGKNFSDMRQVKMFRLKYAIPEQAFSMIDALKSEIGRVLVDQESGNVMIMDTPQQIEQIEKSLGEFEKENLIEVFTLKYTSAKEVEDILRSRLDLKKVGYVKADERNNQIIVQTLPNRMNEVARLINELDKQTKELLIDAKIVKIKLTDQLDSGLEWEGIFKVAEQLGMTYVGSYPFSAVQSATDAWRTREQVLQDLDGSVASYPFSGTTSNYAASTAKTLGDNMHIGVVDNKRDFDIVADLLQTLGDSRVIANPKIVVVNNQEAKIHVGERQAYVTSTTTTGQTTSTISEEVHFEDVGIQLSVTPNINDDGYITMKVRPEISSVSSTLVTPTGNKIPIVDTSLAETTVMMQDGTTLIIGGLRKEEKSGSREALPLIGKIPILKSLFGSGTSKTDRTELLVLITPHIISGKELTTGDETVFGDKIRKEYRGYKPLTSDKSKAVEQIPEGVEIKPYQDYLSLKDKDTEQLPLKGPKYDSE